MENKFILKTNKFIIKANEIHCDKYDYSLVNYINKDIKVKIICPEHGVFEQAPVCHVTRKQGCPKCSGKVYSNNDFIEKANKIHKNFYDYIEYNGKQHYEYIPFFHRGGKADLDKQKSRDSIIKDYCLKNNLKLEIIKYDENVEMLTNKIISYGE